MAGGGAGAGRRLRWRRRRRGTRAVPGRALRVRRADRRSLARNRRRRFERTGRHSRLLCGDDGALEIPRRQCRTAGRVARLRRREPRAAPHALRRRRLRDGHRLLRARATPRVRFTAARSTCGDQYLDGGEACELTTPCASAGTPCIDCQCDPMGSTTTTTTLGSGTTTTTAGGLFEAANPWNVDVSGLPAAAASSTIIAALSAAGGWGNGATALQIDFSLHLLHVDATTPFRTFAANPGYTTPDCDAPFPFPLPVGGAIEGQPGYSCNSGTQDCHLLVVDAATKRLYEMYQANLANGTLSATCALTWDSPGRTRPVSAASSAPPPMRLGSRSAPALHCRRGRSRRDRARHPLHPAERPHAGRRLRAPGVARRAPSGGPDLPPYGVRFRLRPTSR